MLNYKKVAILVFVIYFVFYPSVQPAGARAVAKSIPAPAGVRGASFFMWRLLPLQLIAAFCVNLIK